MLDATASVGAVGVNDLITAVTAWLGVWGTSFVVPLIEKLDLAISPVASKWLKPIQPVMALVLGATVLPKLVALLHLPADVAPSANQVLTAPVGTVLAIAVWELKKLLGSAVPATPGTGK